ncbi:MAG TPA: NAD-dependent epimerase/dehydratase family protein [Dehalococcoidia bacterium]|nr:NAD-dependent epimerase/dehydratase family protein [Dehalococcoidia bacterium]
MKALVTGASGFIGSNLVRELLRHGYEVRALLRKGSDTRNLDGLKLEMAYGDLRDPRSLEGAVAGCDVLFHAAACYTFWLPQPRLMYEINVKGTENILSAAMKKGIKRAVYTSTCSTIGISTNGLPSNEETELNPDDLVGHYKKSKYLAESVAWKFYHLGLPLVVVNPTTPVGAYDIKPTPTGKMIVDYLNRRMFAYVETGLNIVAVEDVAKGHILALERGRPGQRYLLGNQNLTLKEVFFILEQISGIPAPRAKIPVWLATGVAYIDELIEGGLLRRPPRIPVASVKMARKFMFFDSSRAVRELGLPQTPVEQALERAVRWFTDNGYVKG